MDVMTDQPPSQSAPRDNRGGRPSVSGRQLRELFADETWLDELIDRAEEGGVALTGEGGFLPELVKAVLERGLAAELTGHLGYERGDPAGIARRTRATAARRRRGPPRSVHYACRCPATAPAAVRLLRWPGRAARGDRGHLAQQQRADAAWCT